jgi:sigma-B regulation protein RsbU (phosphoserine phosphatase)
MKIDEMIRRLISKIPIKISVPLLFTVPVLGVVIVLLLLFHGQSKTAINNLIEQNLTQIHNGITTGIDNQMKTAVRLSHVDSNLIEGGKLDMSHLRELGKTFFDQLQIFDMLSAIVWFSADGRALWVARDPHQSGYELVIKDHTTPDNIHKYRLDTRGQIIDRQISQAPEDSRLQPWYQNPVQTDKPTWREVCSRHPQVGSESIQSVDYLRPVRNTSGEYMGMIEVELNLAEISRTLKKLPMGKTGRAFVMDRSGRLIAGPTETIPYDAGPKQLETLSPYDKTIAAAAKQLKTKLDSSKNMVATSQHKLIIDEKPYFLMASPSKVDASLNWIIATLVPESDFMAETEAGLQQTIKIGILAVLVTILLGVVFAAISLRPMLDLIAFVRRVGKGDLDQELRLGYSTDFVQLSKELNAMAAGLRDRMRIRHTLALAMEVQQNLLPQKPPKVKGIDIAGAAVYCDETGGDYYDYLDIGKTNGDKIGVVVGDVSDHGIQSALLMVSARALIRQHAQHSDDIAKIVGEVNWHLAHDLRESGHFMTLFLCEIDVSKRTFQWVRAGHDPGIFYDPKTDSFDELSGKGLPLGIFENTDYEKAQMPVKPGQIFFIGTDGIWETRNPKGEEFGKDAVNKIIRAQARKKAKKIRNAILDELKKFRKQRKMEDDVTLVVIKVNEDL